MNQNRRIQKSLGNKLSQAEIDFFHQNGYLHFSNFLDLEKVKEAADAIDQLEKYFLDNEISTVYGVPLRFGTRMNGEVMVQRFAFASKFNPTFHHILKDPRIESLLQLLGPSGRIGEDEKDGMVINHYLNTKNSKFSRLGWHTDTLRELLTKGKVEPMLNVGIHLDDYPKTLGGLRVLPGTHNQSIMKMLFRKSNFRDNEPDPGELGFDIRAGDLTVHDGRLWHRVAKSPIEGEKSRRRVLYVPLISGKYAPKSKNSKTAFYHKLGKFAKFS